MGLNFSLSELNFWVPLFAIRLKKAMRMRYFHKGEAVSEQHLQVTTLTEETAITTTSTTLRHCILRGAGAKGRQENGKKPARRPPEFLATSAGLATGRKSQLFPWRTMEFIGCQWLAPMGFSSLF